MTGKRNGVATKIKEKVPAALPVHCFAHSLNLCLQDAGRKLEFLRNALDTTKEIAKLINFSPKRSHLFSEKLAQPDSTGVSIKLLCPTRWTARTGAIEAVLKDYSVLMETMEEIHHTTHDEYGLKAGGILASLEKFDTLFGLKLGYLVFGASESLSKSLQGKNTSLQEALSAVNLCKSFYRRQRQDQAFNTFYDGVVKTSQDLKIDPPCLPRYRRVPARLDDGSLPHRFSTPRDYFRNQYYQACDLLLIELDDRFNQTNLLPPVLALESVLINPANGSSFDQELETVKDSCYGSDLRFDDLKRHLLFLVDVIK